MDRTLVLSILGIAVLGCCGVLLLMPPAIDDGQDRLPWRITLDGAGRTQVFGFTLGQTTLAEVRAVFGEDGTLELFLTPGAPEPHGAETYFEQIHLQGLRANFVVALAVDQPTLAAMHDRGLRISQTGTGSKRIRLDPDDAAALAGYPLRAIAYLPKARLEPELLERRFGPPPRQQVEAETGIVHWLYPDRGVDLARAPDGRVVIQYVNPDDFERLLAPLAAPSARFAPDPSASQSP